MDLFFIVFTLLSCQSYASMSPRLTSTSIKCEPIIKFDQWDSDESDILIALQQTNACTQQLYTLPNAHIINKELSKVDDFKDLLSITHLDAVIGSKMLTKQEIKEYVYSAVDKWSDYRRNIMLKMFTEQIVDSVVNNILTITPKNV
ncbi:hypothetical protein Noda2021_00650 [Candidatus Dependentiae bacterium Noda2021]|nr:hypothetical protein Noda2021_00650 [Candidatus Dependentiae bacterium Noda2021]